MEKTGTIHVDLGDTTKLTWIEYKLEQFVELIKERLSEIVQPKDVVSDFDKSMWFTSIVVLLGKVLPANRFLFRIIEEENQFLIQFHDSAQLQQPQTIEVPYRKDIDWKIADWKDSCAIPTAKERQKLLDYWKSNRKTLKEIANHFGVDGQRIISWSKSDSMKVARSKHRPKTNRMKVVPTIARTYLLLKDAGVNCICFNIFKNSFHRITGDVAAEYVTVNNTKVMSSDIPKCLDIATEYTKDIIEKIKEINALTYTSVSIKRTLVSLSRSAGIRLRSKSKRDPVTKGKNQVIDHNGLERCLDFYTNVLNNLNNQRKEL